MSERLEELLEGVRELLGEIRDDLRRQNALLSSHSKATLSITQAARLLGVDRHELGRRVAAGEVRSIPVGQRARIPRAEVERLAQVGLPARVVPARQRRRRPVSVGEAIRAIPLEESGHARRSG